MRSDLIVFTSMICITILEAFAIYKGMNGMVFTMCVGVIAGLGGYMVRSPVERKE